MKEIYSPLNRAQFQKQLERLTFRKSFTYRGYAGKNGFVSRLHKNRLQLLYHTCDGRGGYWAQALYANLHETENGSLRITYQFGIIDHFFWFLLIWELVSLFVFMASLWNALAYGNILWAGLLIGGSFTALGFSLAFAGASKQHKRLEKHLCHIAKAAPSGH